MKRAGVIVISFIIGAIVLIAAIVAASHYRASKSIVYTDGEAIRQPVETAAMRDILWQPPVALPEAINTAADEYEGRLSADGLTLLFVRGAAGSNANIFGSRRRYTAPGEAWTEPDPLASINSDDDDLGPEMSRDGQLLIFYSNRPGGFGGYDIWISHRNDHGWQTPINAGPAINTEFNEYSPALSPDGAKLYFASNRPQPGDAPDRIANRWPATIREGRHHRDYDLYVAAVAGDEFGEATALPALNSAFNEGSPAVSPAGDFLYFCSDRPDGIGGFDLYRARLRRGLAQSPTNLGPEINTGANELDPALGMGGFELVFSSDRQRIQAGDDQDRPYDLFTSKSREVFAETVLAEAPIDWASLIDLILPSFLWLLVALLALLALLALWRGIKSRRLSLLARCLLASLAAHLLCLILLMFWNVTTSLREAFDPAGARVALTAAAASDEITTQIRGNLTDMEIATNVPAVSADRFEPELFNALNPTAAAMQSLPTESVIKPSPRPLDIAVNHAETSPPIETPLPAPLAVNLAYAPPVEGSTPASRSPQTVAEPQQANAPAPPIPARHQSDGTPIEFSAPGPSIVAISPAAAPPRSEIGPVEFAEKNPPADAQITAQAQINLEIPQVDMPVHIAASDVPLPVAVQRENQSEPVVHSAEPSTPKTLRKADAAIIMESSPSDAHLVQLIPAVVVTSTESPAIQSQPGAISDAPISTSMRASDVASPAAPPFAAVQVNVALPLPSETAGGDSPSTVSESVVTAPERPAMAATRRAESSSLKSVSLNAVQLPPETTGRTADPYSPSVGMAAIAATDAGFALAAPSASDASTLPVPPPFAPHADNIAVPVVAAPPEENFAQRKPENRREILEQMGGSDATERAVELALRWLAAHQSPDGRWAARKFDDDCHQCGGGAKFDTDIAATSLALLCFLGADHTHIKDGPYRENVNRALAWLLSQQKQDGDWRGGESMYSHGIASIAVGEAYGMTRDEHLASPIRNAVNFIAAPANLNAGGWRYEPGQPGDTSVLGWQIMAIVSARRAGFDVPPDALRVAGDWLDRVSTKKQPGLYAYQPGQPHSPSMTAEAMFVQQLLGLPPQQERMRASADFLLKHPPDWRGNGSTYYWYYATLAMFQTQGQPWQTWNEALTRELLGNQRTHGAAAGSWDPYDRWSRIGGRVYQTALCTLCLEVYYRYLPMYGHTDMVRLPD